MPNTVVSMGNPKRPLVLVIDDDPDLRNLLSDYLSMNDFDVLAVQDGQNMKKVMSAHSPDVIVLDLMLPGDEYDYLKPELLQEALANASDETMADIAEAASTGNDSLLAAQIRMCSYDYWLIGAKGEAEEYMRRREQIREDMRNQPPEIFEY